MKKLGCLILACLSTVFSYAQEMDSVDYNAEVKYVQIRPSFPGGIVVWNRYLERNQDNKLWKKCDLPDSIKQQTVVVSFLVDKEGVISEVTADNATEVCPALAQASVNLIKKGPKWMPAQLHGRNVIYRNKQNITWSLKK